MYGKRLQIFGAIQKGGQGAKWPKERIDTVLKEARSGDYANALCVLLAAMDEIEGAWSEQAQAELI